MGSLEGFTFGSILAGLISGLWTNLTDRTLTPAYKSFINYLNQGGRPVNHDLQKAVKRSLLKASKSLALECRNELAGRFPTFHAWWPFFPKQHRSEVRWLNRQLAQWSKDLKAIERVESFETPIQLPEDIGLLLTSENTLSLNIFQKIKDKFLAEALKGNEPACYVEKVKRERAGLFQLVCIYFADELKNNQQVSNIFEGQLLVKINDNLNAHINASQRVKPLTLQDLEEALSNVNQVMIKLRDKLVDVEKIVDEGFTKVTSGIEEIKVRLNKPNDSGTISSSRYRLAVVINAETFSVIYEAQAKAIIAYLREVSCDSSLTIVGIERGSIILVLEGSEKGIKQLEDLHKSAQLAEILGLRVRDVQRVDSQAKTTQETAKISIDSYLTSQSQIEKILQKKLNIAPEEKLFGIEENLEILRQYLQDTEGSWFISVTGAGGIGKTSIVEKLVRENTAKLGFEKLAWITAKRRALNPEIGEIELIGDNLNVDSMIIEIARQLEIILPPALEHQFTYLQEKLQSVRYLVVIDNLETLEEYQTLFAKFEFHNAKKNFRPSKVIFTSRVKLQGSRIDFREKEIRGLSENASLELIRYKGNDIERIKNATARQLLPIYDKTEGNPLLIKLVVSLIRRYDSPLDEIIDFIRSENKLLAYLYGEAIDSISDNANRVLSAMTNYSHSSAVPYQKLKNTSGLGDNELKEAIQECVRLSLLLPLPHQIHEEPRYSIHNLLYEYLNGPS
ncbi:NB-ARC domain-containing protein [Aerosakkonemataceae cyanobacterium BLCC-F154]|uniref:NB-ARC domain-containing protein n=1 Tax=Floridaenema fluviatile BLCC-F154 TaxID=3153640 RepID=A0ABV4YD90_9CYAN